jgi:hypothetical protein
LPGAEGLTYRQKMTYLQDRLSESAFRSVELAMPAGNRVGRGYKRAHIADAFIGLHRHGIDEQTIKELADILRGYETPEQYGLTRDMYHFVYPEVAVRIALAADEIVAAARDHGYQKRDAEHFLENFIKRLNLAEGLLPDEYQNPAFFCVPEKLDFVVRSATVDTQLAAQVRRNIIERYFRGGTRPAPSADS